MTNASLSPDRIGELLEPFYPAPSPDLLAALRLYLELLMKWNARTNLTAIRDPDEIVRRHFGESLFTALHIPQNASTLLDLGSGAGFPGIPIALARPGLQVTLAESQNKKASFLREAVRTLGSSSTVWSQRAESLPTGTTFDVVTMRAVDDPAQAMAGAESLVAPGGMIMLLAAAAITPDQAVPVPQSNYSNLYLFAR